MNHEASWRSESRRQIPCVTIQRLFEGAARRLEACIGVAAQSVPRLQSLTSAAFWQLPEEVFQSLKWSLHYFPMLWPLWVARCPTGGVEGTEMMAHGAVA